MREHTHAIGKHFFTVKHAEPADLLEAAEKTHHYLELFRVTDADGSYWIDSLNADHDLGFENGSAGISYFYLALYHTTKNNYYLQISQEGFRFIRSHWRKQLSLRNPDVKCYELNVTSGIGSIAATLLRYYEETKDSDSLAALREMAAYIHESATRTHEEVSWTGLPYYALGDSGIALVLLRLSIALDDRELSSIAVTAAKSIVRAQKPNPRGGMAWDTKPDGYPHHFPNFVIGTSGIGYVMSMFYAYTKDEVFLTSAQASADYLNAIAIPLDDGALVPLVDDPYNRTFYVGACHGPGGTSKLFYQLYLLTGDIKYKRSIEEMNKGMLSLGAPEVQSAGYWNNTCVCCGTAALLQLYTGLYTAFGDRHYLDIANRCAAVLLGEAEDVGNCAISWPLAETRLQPDTITQSKGYMHGAAGIASMLLQLYQVLNGTFHWMRLIDDPYPEHC